MKENNKKVKDNSVETENYRAKQAEYMRNYRAKNPDKAKAQKAHYLETHRDYNKEYMRRYQEEHKEEMKAKRAAHREEYNAYQNAYAKRKSVEYRENLAEVKALREELGLTKPDYTLDPTYPELPAHIKGDKEAERAYQRAQYARKMWVRKAIEKELEELRKIKESKKK